MYNVSQNHPCCDTIVIVDSECIVLVLYCGFTPTLWCSIMSLLGVVRHVTDHRQQ